MCCTAIHLTKMVKDLLACAELNQDSLEPRTITLVEQARAYMKALK